METEVTPEMVQAGLDAFAQWAADTGQETETLPDLVERVFRAIANAIPEG